MIWFWILPATRLSSIQSRWFGDTRNIVEHRQPNGSSVTTVRSGATSWASRLTRWISVATAQTMPTGLAHDVDDAFGRAALVGRLDDLERALGMRDHLALRILLAERVDLLDGEARVDRAVPLPQQQLGVLDDLRGQPAADLVGIPDGHPIERDAHLEAGVAAEMLVRQHQQLLAALPRPGHHRRGVGRGADDAAVRADEGFDGGRRVDVGDRDHPHARRAGVSTPISCSSRQHISS